MADIPIPGDLKENFDSWPPPQDQMAAAPKIDIMKDILKTETARGLPVSLDDIKGSLHHFLKYLYHRESYSSLSAPEVHTVKTSTVGSFALYYYTDWSQIVNRYDSSDIMKHTYVVLTQCRDRGDGRGNKLGMFGGYTELGPDEDVGETPKQGALRELMEEARDPSTNIPVLGRTGDEQQDLIRRFQLLASGISYVAPELPRTHMGYAVQLTREEFDRFRAHVDSMHNLEKTTTLKGKSMSYWDGVREDTGGEVNDIQIMSLVETDRLTRDDFARRTQFELITELKGFIERQHEEFIRAARAGRFAEQVTGQLNRMR